VTMDVKTGELMGRYVAEERDTGRLLRSCHARLAGRRGMRLHPISMLSRLTLWCAPLCLTSRLAMTQPPSPG